MLRFNFHQIFIYFVLLNTVSCLTFSNFYWFFREKRKKSDMQSKNVYIVGAAVAALSMVAFALQRKIYFVISKWMGKPSIIVFLSLYSLLHPTMCTRWSRSEYLLNAQCQSIGSTIAGRCAWVGDARGENLSIFPFMPWLTNPKFGWKPLFGAVQRKLVHKPKTAMFVLKCRCLASTHKPI